MNKHILLVDDDPQLVKLMAIALERAGWRVSPATSLQEAQSVEGPFDAVVADIRLPNGDGRDLKKYFHGVPFLSISGGGSDADLAKPFSVRELQTAVRLAIGESL